MNLFFKGFIIGTSKMKRSNYPMDSGNEIANLDAKMVSDYTDELPILPEFTSNSFFPARET